MIVNPASGSYEVSLDASGLPAGYSVMVRIIHANLARVMGEVGRCFEEEMIRKDFENIC